MWRPHNWTHVPWRNESEYSQEIGLREGKEIRREDIPHSKEYPFVACYSSLGEYDCQRVPTRPLPFDSSRWISSRIGINSTYPAFWRVWLFAILRRNISNDPRIIPQAVCTRYGLVVGAFFAWPVRILMWLVYIVAFPIAKLLDCVLGHQHGVVYRRAGISFLFKPVHQ